MNRSWNCIVITCPTLASVIATEREIEYLKKKERIPNDVCVLTIEDPAKNLGSGAATLNALLVAVEYLSAKQNYMVLSSDVLLQSRILIIHNGRDYLYTCTGKAFITLPEEYAPEDKSKPYSSSILSNLESVFQLLNKLSYESPFGVWVCSTDMLISQKKKLSCSITWENVADVVIFCIPSEIEYATGHGVISIDNQGYVSDIFYCQPFDQIKDLAGGDRKVPIVSGIVFMKSNVAESLLSLHVQSPLDSCTYLGLDYGNEPIQVSLYFDLLVAMSTNMRKDVFISGKCGKTYNSKFGIKAGCSNESILARSLVWKELSNYKMSPSIMEGSEHLYWSNEQNVACHVSNLFNIASTKGVHSVFPEALLLNKCLIINSVVEAQVCEISSNVVIIDSLLQTNALKIGENCFISGTIFLESHYLLNIPSNLVIIFTSVHGFDGKGCYIVFGFQENLYLPVDLNQGTFCNRPWPEILKHLSIEENELWSSELSHEKRNLSNAKLFSPYLNIKGVLSLFLLDEFNENISEIIHKWKSHKRYSLAEIMENINYSANFDKRREMYAEVVCSKTRKAIYKNEDLYLLPYFYAACAEDWSQSILNTLDSILLSDTNSVIETRTLSCIADLLSVKAGVTGGLRSGPGSNRTWSKAFSSLLNGDVQEGLKEMFKERSKWLSRPDHLMRAARHYERAAQIFIQNSVKTVKEYMMLTPAKLPDIGVYITAECPARIDLQGGWSDTPPICYELGGSVVNIAILVDGKKPIGARACRIQEQHIILKIIGLDEMKQIITIKDIKDVMNYDQPNAEGSLLKAALICTNIVDITSEKSLKEQLASNFGGGFELESWSLLPQGCGMGTSSILAGATVSVLWSVTGKSFDKSSAIHAVLYIEQLLTTGGGWQDQVSGINGGINRGYSEATLPLHVKVEPLEIPNHIVEELNSRLLLIYTGKVRLAKNLLQNVIRNWYAREETVVQCFKNLILNSFAMKEALLNGNFIDIGKLMDKYWEQKKILAPGCEPASVKEIMDIIKPLCYGQLLVGAGGGGFMCILTKEVNAKAAIDIALQKHKEYQKLSIHMVTVDMEGLQITP